MRAQGSRGQSYRLTQPPEESGRRGRIPAILILLAMSAVTLSVQLSVIPNHAVAWVLWGTREMLDGARWGRDVIEANPPLAWFLAMPTTALAGWINVPIDWTFRAAVTVAAAASAASIMWLAPRQQSYRHALVLCAT